MTDDRWRRPSNGGQTFRFSLRSINFVTMLTFFYVLYLLIKSTCFANTLRKLRTKRKPDTVDGYRPIFSSFTQFHLSIRFVQSDRTCVIPQIRRMEIFYHYSSSYHLLETNSCQFLTFASHILSLNFKIILIKHGIQL